MSAAAALPGRLAGLALWALRRFGGRLVAVLRPSIDESIIEEDHFITMIALLEPKLASVLGLVLNCLWSSRSMDIPA